MGNTAYIHGYTPEEQQRLVKQARFLGAAVFQNVDFSDQDRILEVGCGVGAETELLFEHFPHLQKITGIDREEKQVRTARDRLKTWIAEGRFEALVADAKALPFPAHQFDGAFICWILEHVPNPLDILKEAFRVLEPGGLIHIIEVNHDSFEAFPKSEVITKAWEDFGKHQEKLGGDPRIGPKLPELLRKSGFVNLRKFPAVLDSREYPHPGSHDLWDYFLELIESSYASRGLDPNSPSAQALRSAFRANSQNEGGFLRYVSVSICAEKP